jgi:GNAT superfamily N-acetyltransferase
MNYDIESIAVPSSLHDPDAIDFIACTHIRNTVEALAYGTSELAFTPEELLPRWQNQVHEQIVEFGIRENGTIVARSVYQTIPDATTAWLAVEVLPEHRNRGMGTALADHIEEFAETDGRTNLLVYCVSADSDSDRLYPPTEFGSVPLDNPEVRFLLGRGYSLEQVERGSRLALPIDVPGIATRLAAVMPAGYKLHYWRDRTPDEWAEGIVEMLTRMSTDAPSAGLDEPEDPWSVERLRADEDAQSLTPRNTLVAAVEHAASARLVGFTELSVPAELKRTVAQEDTIVLPEHRGHRLGTVLKLANLLHLEREKPGHPGIITFNAEENRHMLRVNEAVGFVPIGYEGAWKKDVSWVSPSTS